MKKSSVKKNNTQQSDKNNKITSYFTKFKPPPAKTQTSLVDNEDIIEDSPQKFCPPKKSSSILEDVTNTSPTSNTNQKKRKCLSKNFENEDDFEVEQPFKKKQTEKTKENGLNKNEGGKSFNSAEGDQKLVEKEIKMQKLKDDPDNYVSNNRNEKSFNSIKKDQMVLGNKMNYGEFKLTLGNQEKSVDVYSKSPLGNQEKSVNSYLKSSLENHENSVDVETKINQTNQESNEFSICGDETDYTSDNEENVLNKQILLSEENQICKSPFSVNKYLIKKENPEEESLTFLPNNLSIKKENVEEKSPNKNTYINNKVIEKELKTPEKIKGHVSRELAAWTPSPGKHVSPSRNGYTQPRSTERGSARKRTPCKKTPKKLFEMSPNVSEFKVEVLNNFIKITPSKKEQSKEVVPKGTPIKSAEKKQGSILQFASPCTPRRSLQAQFSNEKTPDHKTKPSSQTPSSRVKMKLDFALLPDTSPIKNNKEINDISKVLSPDGKKMSPNVIVDGMDDVGDEFFDDSWEENFEFTASYTLDLSKSQHCKVVDVVKENFKQTVTVQSTKSEDKAVCTLTDFWADARLEVGSTVHLTAVQSDSSSEWIVNNSGGLLVYEPDFLISSTSVVGALFCKRKSVLKDRYAGFAPSNKAMLVGTLVHELLQTCLKNRTQNPKEVAKVVSDLLNSKNIIFELYDCGLPRSEIEEEMKTFIPRIIVFMEQYLKMNLGSYPSNNDKNNWKGRIDSIQDIEENIWCPELGLKGKVDVSVKVQGSIMPLELKTGRATMSLEHRGQIVLYIMMMNKFGYEVPAGLLLYLREGVVRDIPMNEREKRDLIILRNELTYYLTRKPTVIEPTSKDDQPIKTSLTDNSDLLPGILPPPINHHSACGRCEYNTLCCVYLRNDGANLSEFRNLSKVSEEVASHLEKEHIDYFMHWSSLLALENSAMEGKPLRDIYTKTPEEREKNGKCLINTVITNPVLTTGSGLYSTTFTKRNQGFGNLLTSGIGECSYLVVSRDDRPAVAAGLVSRVDHASVTVELDRDLSKKYPNSTFHLDTYDSTSINTFNFTSLSILMEDTERADKLRKLIIEKEKPTFKKTLPSEVGKKSGPILKRMNKMQQKAVIKALAANDYLLIKGMPGTGKTATIVALIQFLVELNHSVLITSHTNSAVDNLCVRLHECGIDVLRLGSESRIHAKLKNRSESVLTKNCKTPEDLEAVYNNAKVIAVTCIGSKHPILSKRTMDICIVDESTQVLQPSVFRPLYASKKFILIGDPDQLPPIVKNREALARGLSQSLFERLQSPESLVTLTYNYRMNKTITALANNLTYNGQLLIANDSVANATMRLTKLESLSSIYRKKQWVLQALDHDLKKSVCVVDTGPVWNKIYKADWIQKSSIDRDGEEVVMSCANPSEAAVIFCLVNALIKGGLTPSCIGVIAPYRAQISQLSAILEGTGVDVNTVDQFQGQDKEVVLYSCTKSKDLSNPRNISKFEILEDKRRLTVAITRAKHKFIMVADVATIRLYSPFCKLLNAISSEQCMRLTDGESGFDWDQLVQDCRSGN